MAERDYSHVPLAHRLGIREGARVGLDAGLVDNKVCSIDATWTAVRFVTRRRDRPR